MMEKDGLLVMVDHFGAIATWLFIGLTSAFVLRWLQSFSDAFAYQLGTSFIQRHRFGFLQLILQSFGSRSQLNQEQSK